LKLSAESYPPLPLFPGDENRTSQVLEGLTTAAIRRTSKGRVMLKTYRIAISRGLSESRVPLPAYVHLSDGIWEAVSIIDTSSGLSPDTQRALTSALTDPEAGKTGPGLSMGEIRMIAESLGASLWHEQTHAGSAITFAIPVA
jgi:signal transduction histidine kinase